MALAMVWVVFRDPALDHRMVIVGAVLPDLIDGPFGGARVMHTLGASAALLSLVMLFTRGRRHARRSWLALPIGTFAHLIFDGAWTVTATFWWPLFGRGLTNQLPALSRGVELLVLQELVGAVVLIWFWWRFGLSRTEVRDRFRRTGRLPREVAQGS
ncbi:MAG: hypothetical protein ACRDRT_08025 [Pseudonocardiaceae bacterium]